MADFTKRMIRAAKLDGRLYEEVEADHGATGQAAAVVIISSLAAGIGALPGGAFSDLVFSILAALLGWVVWALMTYWIGTRLLPEPQTRANIGEMLRTVGFSSAPGIILIISIIPLLLTPSIPPMVRLAMFDVIHLTAWVWMLIAMVVAVRQALDYRSTGRAIAVCAIGLMIVLVLQRLAGVGPFVEKAY